MGFVLCLFVCLALAFAQQEPAQKAPASAQAPAPIQISVPLTVGENRFSLRFDPSQTSAKEMATKFCTEQGPSVGITEATMASCVKEVEAFVQAEVDRWLADRTLELPVVVSGKRFEVSFLPERDDVNVLAGRLCAAESLGLAAEAIPGCVGGVVDYLTRSARGWAAEKTFSTSFRVGDLPFDVSFMPERQSAAEVAASLCADYATQLSLTAETAPKQCVEPVTQFLAARVEAWARSKTLSTTVTINNQPYSVSFLPERESVQSLARRVCVDKAAALQLTNENFAANCFTPLVAYFEKEVAAWVESKRVTVPLTIGAEQLNAVVVPERETTLQVAQKICVDRAARLGLTSETLPTACVEPVNKLLVDGVNNWLAQRERQQKAQQA